MSEKISLEVVTPEKLVVSEKTQTVMAPGSLGEFGILNGHTPFLTSLKTGAIHYIDEKGTERYLFISGGFAEALPDKVTVLAESAERRRNIDIKRAESARDRALKRLDDKAAREDIDFTRAKIALQKAIHRIRISGGQVS